MSVRRLAVLSWLALGGCSDDDVGLPPLEFESKYALLGVKPADSYPLCGGDLAWVDRRVELVQTRLGVQRETPIPIYVLDVEDIPCGEGALACYATEWDEVYTLWFLIDHEIVHAVARDIEFPSQFWLEGNAALLSGIRTFKDSRITLEPWRLEADELLTYISASHFARFLVETRGWDKYNRAIRGEALDTVYGESADALTQAYERDVPFSYPSPDACQYPPLALLEEGVWKESFELSCDSQEARQFERDGASVVADAAVFRSIVLQAGTYALELRGGAQLRAHALRCQTDILPEDPGFPQNPFPYDIRFEIDSGAPNDFVPNERHVLEVAAGTYWLSISSGTLEPTTATLEFTRLE